MFTIFYGHRGAKETDQMSYAIQLIYKYVF